MTFMKATTVGFLAVVVCCLLAGPAVAHGEIESSDPKADSTIAQVPPEVSVTFSETPADSSKFVVKDGCGDEVGTGVEVQGKSLVAATSGAQPGTWTVTWDVLSAEDGHETEGSISFKVKGEPDCIADGGKTTTPGPKEEPQSFPTIVVVAGVIGIVLVGVALVVRRSAGKD